jgi:quercetin dioxygenase-like cupin family protein
MEASSASTVRIGDLTLRFLTDTPDLVVFEFDLAAGARVPAPHYHRDVDELIYCLEGTLTLTIDGKKQDITAGQSAFIPRGAVHHHVNVHAPVARTLVVLAPGSIRRRYFEEMAEAINGGGKPDLALVKDIMLRHGLVPA